MTIKFKVLAALLGLYIALYHTVQTFDGGNFDGFDGLLVHYKTPHQFILQKW